MIWVVPEPCAIANDDEATTRVVRKKHSNAKAMLRRKIDRINVVLQNATVATD